MLGVKGVPFFSHAVIPDKTRYRRTRVIYPQSPWMEKLQKNLLNFLKGLPISKGAGKSGEKGDSACKTLSLHVYGRFFYLTDLRHAFDSVDLEKLALILAGIPGVGNNQTELALFLRKYCSVDDKGLATGGTASQKLFNIYCAELLDKPLDACMKRWTVTYTRYCDDLCFSASCPIGDKKRKEIRAIIEEAGLVVAHHKSEVLDLQKCDIIIYGIRVEWKGSKRPARLCSTKKQSTHAQGVLHMARKGKCKLAKAHGAMGAIITPARCQKYSYTSRERRVMEMHRQLMLNELSGQGELPL